MEMRYQNQNQPFDASLGGKQKVSDFREHTFKSVRNRNKTGMSELCELCCSEESM